MSDDDSAVKVAVRVRPFNGREKAAGAKRCIDMAGKTTYIYEEDVEEAELPPKEFAFDYSLWSHYDMANEPAGYNPDYPDRPNVDQAYLYETIGAKLLADFWDGYDVCMFAYGQSGSGKSFSMTGTGPKCPPKWQGMIPRICKGVFEAAAATTAADENVSFTITASMLEIYVGKIYDLLIPSEQYNVKTREELQMQVDDVAGLRWLPVQTTDDVADLLVLGFSNQYKAPTGLNVDSSRGHTIYTLKVEKMVKNPKAKKKKDRVQVITTAMRLVDLAGSERTEKVLEITKAQLAALLAEKYKKAVSVTDEQMAEYKAERTTEGRSINGSLTNLGQCVKQVAKLSEIENEAERNKKMAQIAWRASALTRLLKTALNGKCKTLMIAAISPSLSEYPETTSTMRYANTIKMIKSCAVKKVAVETEEQKMARRIKELEEMLAKAMEGGGGGGGGGGSPSAEASEEVLKQLQEMKNAEAEAKRREAEMAREMERLRKENAKRAQAKEGPHLVAIISSELSDGLYVTALETNKEIIAAHASLNPTLPLHGVGISRTKNHCVFKNENDTITLVPEPGSACMVNGSGQKAPVQLHHNDRIRLGGNNYFRLIIPSVMATLDPEQIEKDDATYTYDFAKEESMREVMEAFGAEEDKAAEEKRKKAVAEELAKRELIFQQQQEEARRRAEEEKRLFEEQMKSLQAQYESNASQDKEMMSRIAKEKEEFEKRMRENELMLKAKLEEEERYKQEKLKEEERAAKKRATAKAKLQYDLMDAIPFVRSCNEWAAELNVEAHYEVKIVQEETADGSHMAVSVQLKDPKTNKTEVWDMDTFRTKYGQVMQDYHDNVKNIKEGKPIRLSRDTPFVVSDNAVTTIGNAKCMLNYIFYNMELNDKFHIVSHNGQVMGSIYVKVAPVWRDEQQEDEVLEAESLFDIPSLTYLDLDFSISKCEAIPPQYACNVECAFAFPDFIQTSVIDLEEAKLRKRAREIQQMKRARGVANDEDFMDDDDEEDGGESLSVRGAHFRTEADYKGHDDVNVNPPLEWNKRIRIHNVNKRVIEWLKDSALVIKVQGRGPSKDREAVLITPSAPLAAAPVEVTINGKTAADLAEEVEALRAERAAMEKALEEAKRAAAEAAKSSAAIVETQSAAVVEAVKQGKVSADSELKKELDRLRAETERLRKDAEDKKIALERLAKGVELGSVRHRITDVSLPERIAQMSLDTAAQAVPGDSKPVVDHAAVEKAVSKARAELEEQLEEQRRALEKEKKRAAKAEKELQQFKADWDMAAPAKAPSKTVSSPKPVAPAPSSSASATSPRDTASPSGGKSSRTCSIM